VNEINLADPTTFKLSAATHERRRNEPVGISNSAVRMDTSKSVLAAIHDNRQNYDALTVGGKPMLEVIGGL
jgi:hypothetical protein